MFVYLFILIVSTNAQDPWIEWGKIMNIRCNNNHDKSNECEFIQDVYEEVFETVAMNVIRSYKVNAYDLYKTSIQSPYAVIGERLIDIMLNILIVNKTMSETELTKALKEPMIGWLSATAKHHAGDILRTIRDDEFFEREDVKEYLKKQRNIDLDELKSMDNEELLKLNKQHETNKKKEL